MTEFEPDRRKVLMASGAALTVGLAGCLGNGDDDDDNGDDQTPEEQVEDWLADAGNFDGTIEDHTGEDEVEVTNGPGGDLVFDPPAIRIDEGTTVVWEWDSAGHSVSYEGGDTDDDFDDGGADAEEGRTFEHTFDNGIGAVLYYCRPHRASGHLGAVIVE